MYIYMVFVAKDIDQVSWFMSRVWVTRVAKAQIMNGNAITKTGMASAKAISALSCTLCLNHNSFRWQKLYLFCCNTTLCEITNFWFQENRSSNENLKYFFWLIYLQWGTLTNCIPSSERWGHFRSQIFLRQKSYRKQIERHTVIQIIG